MPALWKDLRDAIHTLRRKPGLTITAVLTLALGTGANVGVLSLVNAVLFRPPPYADPDRLVFISEGDNGRTNAVSPFSAFDYRELEAAHRSLSGTAAYRTARLVQTGIPTAEQVTVALTTSSLFDVLGVRAMAGRTLPDAQANPQGTAVVVVSHGYWRGQLGSSRSAVGQRLTLNGVSHEIVGVMPAGFRYPSLADLWVPLTADEARPAARATYDLTVIGRLAPNVTLAAARSDLESVAQRIVERHPGSNARRGIGLVPMDEFRVAMARTPFLLLVGAAGFVLLIACVNLAHLLMVLSASRRREMALRTALGATRTRLMRFVFSEILVLAVAGCGLGLLLSRWSARVILLVQPEALRAATGLTEIPNDWRMLGVTVVVVLAVTLICGGLAGLQASAGNVSVLLREGAQSVTASRRQRAFSSLFVVSEVALAIVLLCGAGLMTTSLRRILLVDPGFDPTPVLAISLPLPVFKYPEPALQVEAYRRALDQLAAIPGVISTAAIDPLPLSRSNMLSAFALDDPAAGGPRHGSASTRTISTSYFATMGIPLLRGRTFEDRDVLGAPGVAIVNASMASRFWPGENPIGRRLRVAQRGMRSLEVIGVVGDVRHAGLDAAADDELYWPYTQAPSTAMVLVVRAHGDPATLGAPMRRLLRQADPDQPVPRVATMRELIGESRSVAPRRAQVILLGAFSALAIGLAAVGIYGVMANAVAQRIRELGVRLALGATRFDVLWLVIRQGLVLALGGTLAGFAAAATLTRFLESYLFGVGRTDPVVFLAASALLVGVATAASLVPAVRAARLDPVAVMRQQAS